jgi:hypothetical protein
MDSAATVLLVGLLHPDPLRGNRSGSQPLPASIPVALRVLLRRSPAGELTAQVIGP